MSEWPPYLVAIVIAWLTAQGAKYLISVIKTHSFSDIRQLYLSGDMPSSHSATAVSLATVIGLRDGVTSAVFSLAILFAAIVMYDAVMVRRSSGEQGAAIQALIRERKSIIAIPRAAKGHQPIEVVTGAIIGIAIGIAVFLITT